MIQVPPDTRGSHGAPSRHKGRRALRLPAHRAEGIRGHRAGSVTEGRPGKPKALPYPCRVLTIAETEKFRADVYSIWNTDERLEFCAWIAANPEAGEVALGSGGCRKVRWAAPDLGKRGGTRIIYYNPTGWTPRRLSGCWRVSARWTK